MSQSAAGEGASDTKPVVTTQGERASLDVIPRHVAIIMDGNNRWAKKNGKKGLSGHRAGVTAVRQVVEACGEYGVEVLTLFAFSSENWNRPRDEVRGLMELFLHALKREVKRLRRHKIRLKVIGDISQFSSTIQNYIRQAEIQTADDYKVTLVVAASYGGQWDIAQSARKLAVQVQEGTLKPEDISPALIEQNLSTGELPAPDLLIRTSGEHRISNFMLWQCAYSEFYFTDVLWPDFTRDEFHKALLSFSHRQRRFGKTSEQVEAEVTA
ncbi:polyprenyl diphosphate synthase [Sansalvadorimonas verongulae]|uniref:polyprenyl diphosphate synthase n=1 Tax=Sansalvadorimonas verongulae TaxID=2172824 RepID=UPI0012BC6043|nr:polyprenyl diphosphate synthase [Sansalvadorimonas verongulae]MTI13402.1 di-trans,poly-cis-decaprenylcistransferase [Sansalvadorimonas verongulae]